MATRACLNCGEQYEPNNWRQLRCNSCRLPPGYGARLRSAAHRSVAREVQAGRLVNLKVDVVACVDCGRRADRYEHRDYHKPLSVEPICLACNRIRGPVGCPQQLQRRALIQPANALADQAESSDHRKEMRITRLYVNGMDRLGRTYVGREVDIALRLNPSRRCIYELHELEPILPQHEPCEEWFRSCDLDALLQREAVRA